MTPQPPTREFRPIFVVGPQRSGTTLLTVSLGRHSRVAAAPESHFFSEVVAQCQHEDAGQTHASLLGLALQSERIQDMKLDAESLRRRFAATPCELRWLFRALLEQYAAQQGKERVAEKTPSHLFDVPTLLDWYPEARVVCIVRDGRDAVLSLQRAPWAPNDLPSLAHGWRIVAELALRFEARFADRFLRIAFEDLIREPSDSLRAVTRFLDLEFEDALLEPDASGASDAVPDWEQSWKLKAVEELDPDRIFAWRRAASPRQVWLMNEMMRPCLARLGYPDAGLEGCPWRWRLLFRLIRALTPLTSSRPGALVVERLGPLIRPLAEKLRWMEKRD